MSKRHYAIGACPTSRKSRRDARGAMEKSFCACESLERRQLLSTIVWSNRGSSSNDSDRFNAVFGTLASQARAVVDADITYWERVITNFNYSNGTNTYSLTISTNPTALTSPGNGVGANTTVNTNIGTNPAKPATATIGIGWRSGTTVNGNNVAGWYLDPTPLDNSEFTGTDNAFTATSATLTGGDMLAGLMHEMGHAMGLSANSVIDAYATDTGVVDTVNIPAASPPAHLYRVDTTNSHTLWTAWDSGGAATGATNQNGAQHYAPLGTSVTQAGRTYTGAVALMNAYFTNRSIIDDGTANLLQDAYGYFIQEPSYFGTFYDHLDGNGTLTIQPPQGNVDQSLTLSIVNSNLQVQLSVGAPVAGIDPTSILSGFALSSITKVVINMGDGNDTVMISPQATAIPMSIDMGPGTNDVLTIFAGASADTLSTANASSGGGQSLTATGFNITNLSNAETLNFYTGGGGVDAYLNGLGSISSVNITCPNVAENVDVHSMASGPSLTLNGGSGPYNNTFTLDASVITAAGADANIDGNGGTDTLVIDGSAALFFPFNTNVFDGEVTTGNGLGRSADFSGIRNLNIYGSQTSDFCNVYSLGNTTNLNYYGGSGDDSLNLGQDFGDGTGSSWSGNVGGTVTFYGQAGNDTLDVNDTYLGSGAMASYTLTNGLLATPLLHDVNFDSLCENFEFSGRSYGGTSFTVSNYVPTQHLYLNGAGAGASTADSLTIDDRTMAGPPNNPSSVEIYPTQIKRYFSTTPNQPNLIDYVGWASPTYYGNTANSNSIKIYGLPSTIPLAYQMTIVGGTAADNVTLYPHDSSGNLTMNANLGVIGGDGYDTITFDDSASALALNYVFSNPFGGGQTNVSGLGTRGGMAYTNDFEDATIKGGSGNDTISINSYLGTTRLTALMGNGNDSIDYSPTSKDLAATIRNRNVIGFDGQGGTDSSTIWNDSNTSGWTYQDNSGSVLVDRNDGLASNDPNHIFYQLTALNTENTAIRGGAAADTFDVNAATTQPLTVVGQGGLDNVSIVSGIALFNASDDLQSLNINGGMAQMVANGNNYLGIKQLFIGSGASLDLNDNDTILDYTGGSQLGTIQSLINTGRAAGAWTGTGITSTAAKNNSKHNTTLGAMEATDYKSITSGNTAFHGQALDNTAVVIKYTYYGDANFSGNVDGADYSRIDATFNKEHTAGNIRGWLNGDFNGDGVVDGADYSLIDGAFNSQGTALRSSSPPSLPPLKSPGKPKMLAELA